MKCNNCNEKAVFSNPDLCKDHFNKYFETNVLETINKFGLINENDKMIVAVSGGKDSLSLLYVLNKRYDVEALAVDEGIDGYREHTLRDMADFCERLGIKYKIVSFKDEIGYKLDELLKFKKFTPCAVCGINRRYLLNKYSKGYDIIATGHNMDDECQSITMNLLRNNLDVLARLGPKTGVSGRDGFTQRVKPFYFLKEREIMAYSLLNNITSNFNECKYVRDSYRAKIRDILNELEFKHPGTKRKIIGNFLSILPKLKDRFIEEEQLYCVNCGMPSSNDICSRCNVMGQVEAEAK